LLGARSKDVDVRDPDLTEPWHSPERAWIPLMWLIRAVAISLALVLFIPLLQLAIPLP
jgi:hypothetical protein